jgi:DNA-binding winged helix-turn-helix (wHTH) protein
LASNNVAIPIGARAFEIVGLSAQSANETVTKNDVLTGVWPGAVVGENTRQVHMSVTPRSGE